MARPSLFSARSELVDWFLALTTLHLPGSLRFFALVYVLCCSLVVGAITGHSSERPGVSGTDRAVRGSLGPAERGEEGESLTKKSNGG